MNDVHPLKQGQKVLEQLSRLTSDQVQAVLAGYLPDLAEAAVKGTLPPRRNFREVLGLAQPTSLTPLPVIVVPEGSTIADLLALAAYRGETGDVTRKFAVTVCGERHLFLADFEPGITIPQVEERLPQLPARDYGVDHFELALIEDLLCAGIHKDCRRLLEGPVVIAAGSSAVLAGGRRVPYLYGWRDGRGLDLSYYDGTWGVSCRFLLVGVG